MKLWNEAKNIVKLWIEESVWIVKMVWMTLWIVKLRDNILWIVNSETLLIVKSWFMSKKLWNAIKFVNVFLPNSQNFRRSAPYYKNTSVLSHSLNFRCFPPFYYIISLVYAKLFMTLKSETYVRLFTTAALCQKENGAMFLCISSVLYKKIDIYFWQYNRKTPQNAQFF